MSSKITNPEKPVSPNQVKPAWCPGCGNFTILKVLKEIMTELSLKPEETVFVSGIGQAAKLPQYMGTHMFNGLHGRSLPPALAIKAVNPQLKVIVNSGDGCSYGEGGNHFIHQILRNPDITEIVHENQVYGLTKGQASPTSLKGFVTPVQIHGVVNEPLNPIALAIALDASFVARVSITDPAKAKEIMKQAIQHRGYALVDVFQPCVTFNKLNTYQWYKENTYYLEHNYDPSDKATAFKRALETDKYPLGIFYKNPNKQTFEDRACSDKSCVEPLYLKEVDYEKLAKIVNSKRE
jgi:2-oxoglutarate ferredoxin oxidoreductase subunit beta